VHPRHYGQDCGNPIHFFWVLVAPCKLISYCPRSASTHSDLWTPDRYVPTDRKPLRRCNDPGSSKSADENREAPHHSAAIRNEAFFVNSSRGGPSRFVHVRCAGGRRFELRERLPHDLIGYCKKSGILRWTIAGRSHGSMGSTFGSPQHIFRSNEVVHSSLNIRTTKSSVA